MHEPERGRGPGAWRWLVMGLAVLGLASGVACGGETEGDSGVPEALTNACLGIGNHLRECGLLSAGQIDCSDATVVAALDPTAGGADEFVCQVGCFESADCGVIQQGVCGDPDAEPGPGSLSLLACIGDCAERFGFRCRAPGAGATAVAHSLVCDGGNDCADGSDEVGCDLFACGDGISVATSAVCDGFPDCGNERDEGMSCPTFACASGSSVPASYHCDGAPDCSDGSDETGCPARAVINCGP